MNLLTSTQPLRDRLWLGVPAAVAAVALSYAVRILLGPAAQGFPFVIFIPPVILVTFCFGTLPGILAAVLAGIVADATLIAEPGRIIPPWPEGWLALGFYTLTVGIDIALINALTLAFERTARAETGLRSANEELERRVGERTAALERQVADREAAEAQLRQIQKMETIGQLTGGIAHDFNNMLAVVIGSIEMARRRLDRGEMDRLIGSLDSAREGAKRASDLVTRLLAFARQQELAPQTIDIAALLDGMSSLMQRTLGETIAVDIAPAEDLWPCWADPVQLESAILNLAVNARDAMPDGGRMTITTKNVVVDVAEARRRADARPGAYVMIAVGDTGIGMPAATVERAFDPFFTTKEVGKGTGLGLSQLYGFVRQSGGHVTLDSQLGRGTDVRLFLPRHTGETSDVEPGTDAAARMPGGRAETVLVVEDEPGVRLMSVEALRELGYDVVQADGPRQALRLLEARPEIELIFTDIVMPEMDGRALADAARAMRPDIKVVYTTGYARVSAEAEEVPDSAYLPKPFTLGALATTVRDALDAGPARHA